MVGGTQVPSQKARLGNLGSPFTNPELLRACSVIEPLFFLSRADLPGFLGELNEKRKEWLHEAYLHPLHHSFHLLYQMPTKGQALC